MTQAAGDRSRTGTAGAACPTCAPAEDRTAEAVERARAEFVRRLVLSGVSGVLLAGAAVAGRLGVTAGMTAAAAESLAAVIYLASAGVGGWLVAGKAFQALRSRVVNFEVLVVVAAAGAAAIGDLPEAALVVFLFSVGESLEAAGVSRTRRAIGALLDLVPRRALVRRGGVEEEVPAEEVAVGETVVVRPGERFPVDGRVLSGRSFVDQAPITGESMPVPKGPGDEVFAGSVNGQGSLEVVSTRRAEDTTLARIIHLVEEAEREKAGHQKTIDRFAAAYTPAVAVLAVAVAVVPPLVLGGPFGPYVYRALALLLVACPCALVLSTPVAVVAAIGRAARRGVLIKGGSALEAAGRVRAVAFDKTGTLTAGRPEVSDIVTSDGLTEEGVLRLAAAVEWRSEHPVAGAIRREAARRALVPAGGGSAGSG
ncbi:MAG TPA: cadmium-translocating P-type ATPase, partial [Clostridiales bacterium]|nr:cadmium-translocating P-type ATPase [Clostridiales bacterium]